MVNKKFWLGILAMVFGMTVVGSAFGQDTALNGRWRANARSGEYINDIVEYSFLAGNYEILKEYGPRNIAPLEKGTYTTNDKGVISLKVTHFYTDEFGDGKGKWYTKDELIKVIKSEEDATDAEIKEWFEEERIFVDRSFVYSISSDRLQLFENRKTFTFYRQK